MTPWPHQTQAVEDVLAAIAAGHKRILVTCPTGGGKTRIMLMLAKHYDDMEKKVILYTNRKLLVTQTSGVFEDLEHGVRSAGHEENKHLRIQVSSIQTEDARVNKKKTWTLHEADLVLVDEAHLIKADVAKGIFDQHIGRGACVVGFTATPLDLEELYDSLVVAGRPSELRDCGALVSATHYGADEPDLAALKKARKKLPQDGEDFSENQARVAMMNPTLFGRVWEWFQKLNPDHKPTILFAPGTQESLWFAERFTAKGVKAAHVAAGQVWMDGVWLFQSGSAEAEQEARQTVLAASKSGECKVLCNRFLLREGIDAPWLCHGILATIFGALQSYLQSGGRLLRACEGKEGCTIQDHGGNWWRHGSLNSDRHWDLQYTAGMVYGLRAERLREKKESEPWTCGGCGKVCRGGLCPCGWRRGPKNSRPVVTMEGELKEMVGDIFKPRRISTARDGQAKWAQMYYRSLRGKGIKTFRQAMALFAYENHWSWPSKQWSYMPLFPEDEYRLVPDVPRERLR